MDDGSPGKGPVTHLAEEGLADAGQTLADNEQTLADRDQTASDRDQEASDEDQVSADLARAEAGEKPTHARTTATRAEASRDREETSHLRDRTNQERDISAERRDELSMLRDEIARDHDQEAADLDAGDDLTDRHAFRLEEVRRTSRASRIRAKGDRARAARDREQATRDREQAARDRKEAASDREHAATDELTGARRRGVGLEDLNNEMNRAWRQGDSLWAAYVDVDELKSVNDKHGHAAGDALLVSVANGIRRQIRPYDLLVRLGGDEFVCALPNITLDKLRKRFDLLDAELKDSGGGSVSVGFSELHKGDSAGDFIMRADSDLLARRSE